MCTPKTDNPISIFSHFLKHRDAQHILCNVFVMVALVFGYNQPQDILVAICIATVSDQAIYMYNSRYVYGASAIVYAYAGYSVASYPQALLGCVPMWILVVALPVSDIMGLLFNIQGVAYTNHLVALFSGTCFSLATNPHR